jgi:hypothetical protein
MLLQYLNTLDRIFGMYLDACGGFDMIGTNMGQRTSADMHRNRLFGAILVAILHL